MATNLLLLYPHIPFNSTITASDASESGKPVENTILGDRHLTYKESSADTTMTIDYDLGAGVTVNPTYIAIGRADYITRADSADIQVELKGDDNAGFASPETQSDTLGDSDLLGSQNEDYVFSTTFGSAYRYWRVVITTTDSIAKEVSKIYFGIPFDFGTDPVFPVDISQTEAPEWSRKRGKTTRLTWRGVPEATKQDFESKIIRYRDVHHLYLWDAGDYVFTGDKLMHVRIVEASFTMRAVEDWIVSVTFEELT